MIISETKVLPLPKDLFIVLHMNVSNPRKKYYSILLTLGKLGAEDSREFVRTGILKMTQVTSQPS